MRPEGHTADVDALKCVNTPFYQKQNETKQKHTSCQKSGISRLASRRNHETFEGRGSVSSKLAEQEQQLHSDDLHSSAKPKQD